uniref:Uncharacterized protein n=1 Tax=Oryza brachyantha TaxID=4533 RepID=J3M2A0_ORYBR
MLFPRSGRVNEGRIQAPANRTRLERDIHSHQKPGFSDAIPLIRERGGRSNREHIQPREGWVGAEDRRGLTDAGEGSDGAGEITMAGPRKP